MKDDSKEGSAQEVGYVEGASSESSFHTAEDGEREFAEEIVDPNVINAEIQQEEAREQKALRQHIGKTILRSAGMSEKSIDSIYTNTNFPKNKKIIAELDKQAEGLITGATVDEVLDKKTLASKMTEKKNEIIGQIGSGGFRDYDPSNEKAFKAGQKAQEKGLKAKEGGNEKGIDALDDKIKGAVEHQNDKRERGVLSKVFRGIGTVVGAVTKQVASAVTTVLDSKLALFAMGVLAVFAAVGAPVVSAAIAMYVIDRVLDKTFNTHEKFGNFIDSLKKPDNFSKSNELSQTIEKSISMDLEEAVNIEKGLMQNKQQQIEIKKDSQSPKDPNKKSQAQGKSEQQTVQKEKITLDDKQAQINAQRQLDEIKEVVQTHGIKISQNNGKPMVPADKNKGVDVNVSEVGKER